MTFMSLADSNGVDEYSKFKAMPVSTDEKTILTNGFEIVEYWIRQSMEFPLLSRVALRLSITPASSSQVEDILASLRTYLVHVAPVLSMALLRLLRKLGKRMALLEAN